MKLRYSLFALTLPLAAAANLGVGLRFAPSEGTAITKTFTMESSFEGGELEVVMDGQEIPGEFLPDMELAVASEMTITLTDRYVKLADGKPVELLRTYVEIDDRHESEMSMIGLEGVGDVEEEGGASGSSTLEGKTVRFVWDAEESEYATEFEGDDGDVALLDDLVEDTDLRAFLPTEDVDVGGRWTVGAEALGTLLFPGGDLGMTYEGPDAGDFDATPDSVEYDGDITLKLTGTHDDDGDRLATLEVAGEFTLAIATPSNLDRVPVVDGDATETRTTSYVLEGEILWNVTTGHVAGAELEAETTMEIELVKDPSSPGPTFESVITVEGTTSFRIEVESAD